MGIEQLPSGSWRATVQIDGTRHRQTFDTPQDAADWELITRAASITGALPGTATVREYAARWIAGYTKTSTRRFYQSRLTNHILPVLGPVRVSKITPSDVTRFLSAVARGKGMATADAVYRTLHALMSSAQADGLIVRNPVLPKRHRPKRQPEPMTVLERVPAREVLMQLGGWQRDTAVLQLGLGARFGEVAGLTPHDIVGGRVTIRRSFAAQDAIVSPTKNHRLRVLDLPATVKRTVERLVAERVESPPLPDLGGREWDGRRWDGRWLIQTSTGRPPNLSYYDKALRRACQAVGVPPISSHGLRHTYVSWMIDAGHSADRVAQWIGDTPETVRRVYAHMLEGGSKDAADEMDRVLGDLG